MIITEIYNGQGLGNQLACYVTTRTLALDNGFEFGIKNPDKFKCLTFMDLDCGLDVVGGSSPREGMTPTTLPDTIINYVRELECWHPNGSDIRLDDPQLNGILDNTKIDGVFQSENYFIHRKNEIRDWLKIEQSIDCFDYSDDNICVINFRGGEYTNVRDFFLPQSYWDNAVNRMLDINSSFEFVVITDDVTTARCFFPKFDIYHINIGVDFSIIKNAKYLILSNSSFPYFATLLSDQKQYIIAPKFWGRYNISDGYWHCGYNIYHNHNYIDQQNVIYSYGECVSEFNTYINTHKQLWN